MTGRSTPGTCSNSSGVTMARLLAVDGPFCPLCGVFCSASFCLAMARLLSTAARSAKAICWARMSGSTASGSVAAMCSILAIWFLACSARRVRASRACSTVMPPGSSSRRRGVAGRGPGPLEGWPAGFDPVAGAGLPAVPEEKSDEEAGDLPVGAPPSAGGTTGIAEVTACSLSCISRSWRRVGGPPPESCSSFSDSSLMVRRAALSRARIWDERSAAEPAGSPRGGQPGARNQGRQELACPCLRGPGASRPPGLGREPLKQAVWRQGLTRRHPGARRSGSGPGLHPGPCAVLGGCGSVAVPDSSQTHSVLAGSFVSVVSELLFPAGAA
jgi:hypothetical protein